MAARIQLPHVIVLFTLLACTFSLARSWADPDLWGHVQYGQDWLEHGFHSTATYTYTADGYRWINHENIAELVLAIGMRTVGPSVMQLGKLALSLAMLGLIVWNARRQGVGVIAICFACLLVAANVGISWLMRPQVLTWVYYCLTLALLSWCFEGWEGKTWPRWLDRNEEGSPAEPTYSSYRMRFLWLGPVIFCLWANSHGGFVAGYCIYSAYLGLRALEALACRGREAFGIVRRFSMMIVVAGAATLINPYGLGLHLWMLESLGTPRPEITEWLPINMLGSESMPMWCILVTWIAALLVTKRPRDVTHLVILSLTLWQAISHGRHVPFFAYAFGFWAPIHIHSFLERFSLFAKRPAEGQDDTHLSWTPAVLATCLLLVGGGFVYSRAARLDVDRSWYPVSAFRYMADHELDGRMVVNFNWAQYALGAFGALSPEEEGIQISFDGRYRTCYPQEVIDMNGDFAMGHLVSRHRRPDVPFDDDLVLEQGAPNLVLISREQVHAVNVMFRNADQWCLLYQDKLAQLWGRSSRYDDPEGPDYISPDERSINNDEQEGKVAWPAYPERAVRNHDGSA